jgi:hypothetical protein
MMRLLSVQKGLGGGVDPREIKTSYAHFLSILAEFHKRGTDPHQFLKEIVEHLGMRTPFDWRGRVTRKISIRSLPDQFPEHRLTMLSPSASPFPQEAKELGLFMMG